MDLNNDTLVDPEEFHEWFEIVFPVLIEEEEGGHAHRRRAAKTPKMTSANVARLNLAMGRQPSVAERQGLVARNVDKRDGHVHDCPLDEELFTEFDLDTSGFLNSTEVSAVSMEMMVLLLSGCNEEHSDEHSECADPDDWAYWLAGLASTLLVCLLSLVGIVLLPCMGRKHQGWQALMMMSMIGFAAGALFGDAIFHILPQLFGAHSHDHGGGGHGGHGGHEEEEEDEDDKEYLGLASLVLVGALLFFLIEKAVLFFVGEAHSHGGGGHADDDDSDETESSDDGDEKKPDNEMEEKSSDEEGQTPTGSRIGLVVGKLQHSCKHSYDNMKEVGGGSVILGGARQVKNASINSVKRLKFAKSYGWLNLIADAFHNFIDGIAIGASYSQGLSLGISTTLAVIFHEIPQELGDFAMIVRAGFGRLFALAFNLFSATLALLGCIIGLGVGEAAGDGEKWILAFTAGGFLYISLANMVPELHNYRKKRHWLGLVYTALQLSGFLLGAGILMIIAAFEEDIAIDC